ncbi:DJ-1/PfpI family protein [Pseudomonas lalucatii]|uniref:DJ-1/PfpI family protein n=1 Tax=Pseudomonas lalucatii TaxID=1424203 RepID=A0ABS5PZV4_9PSED|nr:DJ-1/PfpI family protein [Pseudomonas lalucatii]MBS7661621.1 DJ-1/PfpI family protein [Pseudomonas lalucatii]MBS7723956.1 DJ-1/PfpI family protein [Pseudomonas lalucatii]QVM88039.1 DJ-1/PfpI family protein [Pseudomonas lalucatii]
MTKTHQLLPIARSQFVLILAFDGVTLTDIAGPSDVFQIASEYLPWARPATYRIVVASVHGGRVRTSCGIAIATEPLDSIDISSVDTLLVPGGGPPSDPPLPEGLIEWLRLFGGRARRVCAICTGAFIVAEAGLADGKRMTSHWKANPVLATRYPAARIEDSPIFVRDGTIWSCAGFSAGIDLALSLLEDDWGYNAAIEVARLVVVFLKRPGDQPQQSQSLAVQYAGDADFGKLHAWMLCNLSSDLSVEALARRSGMSTRTFARRYVEKVGRTPAKTVELFRVEAAARRICETDASLKQIARDCGFGDEQQLRRSYIRRFGSLPSQCVREGLD